MISLIIIIKDLMQVQPQQTEGNSSKKDPLLIVDERFHKEIQAFLKEKYQLNDLLDLVAAFNSENISQKHRGIIGIRKIVSLNQQPPIQSVIDSGVVPRIVQYTRQSEYPQIQLEAAWILTNIASGTSEQCLCIVDLGAIPLFVQLLQSDIMGVVDQAIWAVGNISSDCIPYRDAITREGGMLNLVEIAGRNKEEPRMNICCWALANLCRGNPLPEFQNIRQAIPVLCRGISQKILDKQILVDCCWALSYHSGPKEDQIKLIAESGVIPFIVDNLGSERMSMIVPSLRIIEKTSRGGDNIVRELLSLNIIDHISRLVSHPKKIVRKQVFMIISNITAGNREQVKAITNCQILVDQMIELISSESEDNASILFNAFSNMSRRGDQEEIYNIYHSKQIIDLCVEQLQKYDQKFLQSCLECMLSALMLGQRLMKDGTNYFSNKLNQIEDIGYTLEKQVIHTKDTVYNYASIIMERYISLDL